MRGNAIPPYINGPHYAYPCTCGYASCKSWMVSGVADVQGVSFTQAEAVLVADVLNVVANAAEGVMHPNFRPYLPSLGAAIDAAKKRQERVDAADDLAAEAIKLGGIEVFEDQWPDAERLCMRDARFSLGGCRGPGRQWKRLSFDAGAN